MHVCACARAHLAYERSQHCTQKSRTGPSELKLTVATQRNSVRLWNLIFTVTLRATAEGHREPQMNLSVRNLYGEKPLSPQTSCPSSPSSEAAVASRIADIISALGLYLSSRRTDCLCPDCVLFHYTQTPYQNMPCGWYYVAAVNCAAVHILTCVSLSSGI